MGSALASINGTFFKITNFALGKSVIFIVILGWFLVITGIIFLSQPEKARLKLVRQGTRLAGWALRLTLVYVFLLALAVAGRINGVLSFLFVLAVFVALVRVFFAVTQKSLTLFTEKLALVPVNTLKMYALVQILAGALMITMHRRFW